VKLAGLSLVLALMVPACAPTGQYYWGSYSESLYDYYRDATQLGAYRASLVGIIAEGEPTGRVPPSIYAELGFLELEAGNTAEARRLFEKEKTLWPESAVFMDRMITAIDQADSGNDRTAPGAAPATATPADAQEGTS
jgi:hypothetical protein